MCVCKSFGIELYLFSKKTQHVNYLTYMAFRLLFWNWENLINRLNPAELNIYRILSTILYFLMMSPKIGICILIIFTSIQLDTLKYTYKTYYLKFAFRRSLMYILLNSGDINNYDFDLGNVLMINLYISQLFQICLFFSRESHVWFSQRPVTLVLINIVTILTPTSKKKRRQCTNVS